MSDFQKKGKDIHIPKRKQRQKEGAEKGKGDGRAGKVLKP